MAKGEAVEEKSLLTLHRSEDIVPYICGFQSSDHLVIAFSGNVHA